MTNEHQNTFPFSEAPDNCEILLISLSGRDRTGITRDLMGDLSRAESIRVLDIGQSVIHDTLTFGMLIALPKGQSADVIRDVLYRCHKMELQARFEPISLDDYEHWAGLGGQDRWIVTLLSKASTVQQMHRLSSITAEHNLNILRIDRLSRRVSLASPATRDMEGIELSLKGKPEDPDKLRQDFLALSNELDVDIAFQADSLWRRTTRLVVFDMDSTLIQAEVIDELAVEAGVGEKVAEITERAMRGELDFQASFRERVALLEGLDVEVLDSIAERIDLTDGAEQLLTTLNALGYKTAILSGGFTYFAKRLQAKLGIDYVYANELDIQDGKVTGKVKGDIVDGQRKRKLLKEIAKKEGIRIEQVIAVGDGANDLPMLSEAGIGIAFRAKPVVKATAEHAISALGLDAILYLLGYREQVFHLEDA